MKAYLEAADESIQLVATKRNYDHHKLSFTLPREGAHHCLPVNSVLYHHETNSIITGSRDGSIKSWAIPNEFEEIRCKMSCDGHLDWVNAITFLDGNIMVSASTDKTIQIWDMTNGALLSTLRGHKQGVKSVASCSKSKIFYSGGMDGKVYRWLPVDSVDSLIYKPEEITCFARPQNSQRSIHSMTLSHNERSIAFSTVSGDVLLLDTVKTEYYQPLKHPDLVKAMIFSADDKFLLTGCSDGCLRIWSTEKYKCIVCIPFTVEDVDDDDDGYAEDALEDDDFDEEEEEDGSSPGKKPSRKRTDGAERQKERERRRREKREQVRARNKRREEDKKIQQLQHLGSAGFSAPSAKPDPIWCICADEVTRRIWTGHKSGAVRLTAFDDEETGKMWEDESDEERAERQRLVEEKRFEREMKPSLLHSDMESILTTSSSSSSSSSSKSSSSKLSHSSMSPFTIFKQPKAADTISQNANVTGGNQYALQTATDAANAANASLTTTSEANLFPSASSSAIQSQIPAVSQTSAFPPLSSSSSSSAASSTSSPQTQNTVTLEGYRPTTASSSSSSSVNSSSSSSSSSIPVDRLTSRPAESASKKSRSIVIRPPLSAPIVLQHHMLAFPIFKVHSLRPKRKRMVEIMKQLKKQDRRRRMKEQRRRRKELQRQQRQQKREAHRSRSARREGRERSDSRSEVELKGENEEGEKKEKENEEKDNRNGKEKEKEKEREKERMKNADQSEESDTWRTENEDIDDVGDMADDEEEVSVLSLALVPRVMHGKKEDLLVVATSVGTIELWPTFTSRNQPRFKNPLRIVCPDAPLKQHVTLPDEEHVAVVVGGDGASGVSHVKVVNAVTGKEVKVWKRKKTSAEKLKDQVIAEGKADGLFDDAMEEAARDEQVNRPFRAIAAGPSSSMTMVPSPLSASSSSLSSSPAPSSLSTLRSHSRSHSQSKSKSHSRSRSHSHSHSHSQSNSRSRSRSPLSMSLSSSARNTANAANSSSISAASSLYRSSRHPQTAFELRPELSLQSAVKNGKRDDEVEVDLAQLQRIWRKLHRRRMPISELAKFLFPKVEGPLWKHYQNNIYRHKWFTADTRTGRLTITLELPECFRCAFPIFPRSESEYQYFDHNDAAVNAPASSDEQNITSSTEHSSSELLHSKGERRERKRKGGLKGRKESGGNCDDDGVAEDDQKNRNRNRNVEGRNNLEGGKKLSEGEEYGNGNQDVDGEEEEEEEEDDDEKDEDDDIEEDDCVLMNLGEECLMNLFETWNPMEEKEKSLPVWWKEFVTSHSRQRKSTENAELSNTSLSQTLQNFIFPPSTLISAFDHKNRILFRSTLREIADVPFALPSPSTTTSHRFASVIPDDDLSSFSFTCASPAVGYSNITLSHAPFPYCNPTLMASPPAQLLTPFFSSSSLQ
eukprot:MONOS_7120.1-p1 / transcript=MONOS_7120.1 / gene=MONOS_7120 / organism=Monocercomonoides_exilis_PA203 / gene_product=unspecified product / transcript_product=unspecified product / location=Mono_scaffold00236:78128-83384(+) / protein_length=1407 / sequence_SO=supercontig / SO=protein_coding / is_pseudo=false